MTSVCDIASHTGVPPVSSLAALMDHVSGGSWVSRLPPQQLNSYLYWYVQKLQEKKK